MTDAQRKMRTAICYGGPLHDTKIVTPESLTKLVGAWPIGGQPCQFYELRKFRCSDGAVICVWLLSGTEVADGTMDDFLMMNRRTEKPLDAKTDQR